MTNLGRTVLRCSSLSALLLGNMLGCASPPAQPRSVLDRLAAPASSLPSDSAAVAIVGGEPIAWSELHATMVELSGVEALEEAALGAALRQACQRQAIVVREENVQSEEQLLQETLVRNSGVSESEAQRLLTDQRRRRGLGPYRYRALLERNAMLRALVRSNPAERESVEPRENDLRTAYDIKYGPRIRARIILVADPAQAERAVERLRTESFDRVAADMSLDGSASRGGAIAPVSLADAAQPAALRRVLSTLAPGSVSQPVSVDWGAADERRTGFAIVRHDGLDLVDATPTFEAIRDDLAHEVRAVRERAAMERLGRELLLAAGVRVLDPALGSVWDLAATPR